MLCNLFGIVPYFLELYGSMKRSISISLLLILLAGQFNLTWELHYCGGKIVKDQLTLGEQHLGCGMVEMSEASDCDDTESLDHNCCNNEYFSPDADKDYQLDEKILSQDLVVLYTILHFDFAAKYTQPISSYVADHPPDLDINLSILFQVFRL